MNKFKRFIDRSEVDFTNDIRITTWCVISLFTFNGSLLLSLFGMGILTKDIVYSTVAVSVLTVSLITLYFATFRFIISETVEKLLRKIHDVRRIATITEKERLYPIFDNVYKRVKNKKIAISPNIKLYIVDTAHINAFALSLTTIAVTRGLIETMSDDEIEAIIAHEFGHLYHGDAIAELLIWTLTTVYLWFCIGVKYFVYWLSNQTSSEKSATGIWRLPSIAINFAVSAMAILGGIITGSVSRKKEYRADMFAVKLGYAEPLLSALYKFYDIEISDKKSILGRLQASHPRTAYRIEQVENYCLCEDISEQTENCYNEEIGKRKVLNEQLKQKIEKRGYITFDDIKIRHLTPEELYEKGYITFEDLQKVCTAIE